VRSASCCRVTVALFIRKQDWHWLAPTQDKTSNMGLGWPAARLGWRVISIVQHCSSTAAASHRRVTACRACSLNCHYRWAGKTRQWSVDAVEGQARPHGSVCLVRWLGKPCRSKFSQEQAQAWVGQFSCPPGPYAGTVRQHPATKSHPTTPTAKNGNPIRAFRGLLFKHAFKTPHRPT
jgi:hypothetical protein